MRISRIAGAGFFGFAGLMLVATAVQPDSYQWQRDFISGLAAMDAAYPALMILGFQLGAVGLLATAGLVAWAGPGGCPAGSRPGCSSSLGWP